MNMKRSYVHLVVVLAAFLLCIIPVKLFAAHDYDVLISKGIEKINEGKYGEALEFLQKAIGMAPDDAEARYYAAVAYSRLGESSRAEELFLGVLKDKEYTANAYLELGRLYYVQEKCVKAEEYLKKFISFSDKPDARSYAESLISDCYGKGYEEKPYKMNVSLGAQYDTNVVLEPTNPVIAAERKKDGRAVALVNAGARLYRNDLVKLDLDYNFYQSLHIHLSGFNVQYHKLFPHIEFRLSDTVKPSAGYSVEYIYFGGDKYGTIHTYIANLNVKESMNASTDFTYEFRENRYKDTDVFEANSDRTGRQNYAGLKQRFDFDRVRAEVHYYYDDKKAEKDYWAYRGNEVGASLNYRISTPLLFMASAEYDRRKYEDDFPVFNETRVDRMQRYGVNFQYIISKKVFATLSENYTINDSNIKDFDYRRNIIGLLFTMNVY
jgi:tetratricopeptide (TPR) repeat protein